MNDGRARYIHLTPYIFMHDEQRHWFQKLHDHEIKGDRRSAHSGWQMPSYIPPYYSSFSFVLQIKCRMHMHHTHLVSLFVSPMVEDSSEVIYVCARNNNPL
jgi:hypothetical protein